MSKYLHEVTRALTDVLDRAVRTNDHVIAGYAANVEFWANEVEHRLRILRGFPSRQEFFDRALKTEIRRMRDSGMVPEHWRAKSRVPTAHFYGEADDPAERERVRVRVAELESTVAESAKAFFRKLWKRRLITVEQWHDLKDRFEFLS